MAVPIVRIFDCDNYDEQIRKAAQSLKDGGVVLLPTETVYGAAALVSRPTGLERLRQLSPPVTDLPLSIHLASPEEAARYLAPLTDFQKRITRKLWPGPVGMSFQVPPDRQVQVAGELGVEAKHLYNQDSITLRCPDHAVATDVIRQAAGPVALRKAPGDFATRPDDAITQWGESLDLVIDAGPTRFSKLSTLLKVNADGYEIVRAGVYDQRIIERLLRTTILFVCSGNTCRSPMAEGIARQLLARKLNVSEGELERKGLSVMSAGSFAMPGACDGCGRAGPQAHRRRSLATSLAPPHDRAGPSGRRYLHHEPHPCRGRHGPGACGGRQGCHAESRRRH